MLLGEPSPALTKIALMNTEKLRTYIKQISVNAEQLKTKIDKLQAVEEPDEQRIAELTLQRQRLAILIKTAAERLQGKLERAKEYANGTRQPRRGARRY
jgi:GTP-binding protein EngB required for normal cell division